MAVSKGIAKTKSEGAATRSKAGADAKKVDAVAVPRARAQRLSPDMRRQQLLMCALQVFSEKGLGDGKHADLAQVAAVAVPTTFHYFPTREDLIKATLDEVARYLLEDIVKKNYDPKDPVPETLKKILLAFTDSIESHPEYIRVWLEWSSSVRDGLWGSYLEFYSNATKKIQSIISKGQREGSVKPTVDTRDAACITVGLAHMITHMKFAGNTRATVEHTIDSFVTDYLTLRSDKA